MEIYLLINILINLFIIYKAYVIIIKLLKTSIKLYSNHLTFIITLDKKYSPLRTS